MIPLRGRERKWGSAPVAWAFLPVFAILAAATGVGEVRAGAPELNPAAVFCSYYSLACERPEDRDIEDLCWSMGKPTFSAFKPAEMFSRQALREARRDLEGRMDGIGPDTLFRWEPEKLLVRGGGGGVSFRHGVGRTDLPQATPLIQAEISFKGWKRLQRALKRLPTPSTGARRGEGRIGILLKPLRVENRMEERNIALEEVTIPVRVVVFQPVAVEGFDGKGRAAIPIRP
jgi:hypothetical protein